MKSLKVMIVRILKNEENPTGGFVILSVPLNEKSSLKVRNNSFRDSVDSFVNMNSNGTHDFKEIGQQLLQVGEKNLPTVASLHDARKGVFIADSESKIVYQLHSDFTEEEALLESENEKWPVSFRNVFLALAQDMHNSKKAETFEKQEKINWNFKEETQKEKPENPFEFSPEEEMENFKNSMEAIAVIVEKIPFVQDSLNQQKETISVLREILETQKQLLEKLSPSEKPEPKEETTQN